MSILDDDSNSAASGTEDESIHSFMFEDRAVDAEVVDPAGDPESQGVNHEPGRTGAPEPVEKAEKKKSAGFNIKWVFGGILAVGLVATVWQMTGEKAGEDVSEPVAVAHMSGDPATQPLPAELDETVDIALPVDGASAVTAGVETKIAQPTASAMTADAVVEAEKPVMADANPALRNQVVSLEKEVANLKEQIAGLHQMVGDRNAIASYQQKVHKPKRVSKPKVVSKPETVLPVAQAPAAPVTALPTPAEPMRVPPVKRYTLRGIVYGQAAVERNGALLYVREGDPLGETRVASIDPVAMEVRLANGVSIK